MTASLDELKQLYAARQYDRCWQAAHEALLAGGGDRWTFLLASMSLLRLGRRDEFAATIRAASGNGNLLGAWILSNMLHDEAYEALTPLADVFAPDEPLWLIATYFAGCALVMQDRYAAAKVRFRAFRLALPRFLGTIDFIGDDQFNVMFRQGRLVAEPEEVARRRTLATRTPALAFAGEPRTGQRVVFASANSHYFNAMAGAFVDGMVPHLPGPGPADGGEAGLHLHVIDPDAGSLALIERLRALHGPRLVVSLETPPLFRTYTYYSCARFYVIGALLDRYRAPIVSFDIDIVPTAPLAPLFEVARPFDFCCFRTRRNEPASIFQASVMYWADTTGTRRFLSDLQRFCWEELGSPSRTSWMLDQAALFSLLTETDAPVRFGDYRSLLGRPLEDWVRITFGNEIKGQLRTLGEPGAAANTVPGAA